MKIRTPWCIVVLATILSASPGASADRPSITNFKAIRIGESDAVRLSWTTSGKAGETYELRRLISNSDPAKPSDGEWTFLVHIVTQSGDQVYVDKEALKSLAGGSECHYRMVKIEPKSDEDAGVFESADLITTSRAEEGLIVDYRAGGASPNDFASLISDANSPQNNPLQWTTQWRVKDGNLGWIIAKPTPTSDVRLVLTPSGQPKQILARLAVESFPGDDRATQPRVGVGIVGRDQGTLSAVLQRTASNDLDLRLYRENPGMGPVPLGVSERVFDAGSLPSEKEWIWLAFDLTGDEVKGEAWRDGQEAAASRKTVTSKVVDPRKWEPAGVALIAGEQSFRAVFSEVYVVGSPQPPAAPNATTTVQPPVSQQTEAGEPGPGVGSTALAPSATSTDTMSDEDCEAFKALWKTGFDGLPTVVRLVRRGALTPDDATDDDGGKLRLEECRMGAKSIHFEQAARFTVPRFDVYGGPIEDEGAVIYEGMTFAVAPTGPYEVRFLVSTPAMPVTLRLQLHVSCQDGCGHTLTLPPIEIPSYINPKGHHEAATWSVRHVGMAYINEGCLKALVLKPESDQRLAIHRSGTARFGSMPEPSN